MMGLFFKKKSDERVEIHELIFCPSSSCKEIVSQLDQVFGIQSDPGQNQITLSQDDMILSFTVFTTEDDSEDGKYAQKQLQGVWNYFRQVETEHLEIQRNVLHHLRMCRSVVAVYASYGGAKSPEKEGAIRTQICKAAPALQGLLTQATDVLCDSVGRPIFDKQGNSEMEFYLPPKHSLPDEWRQEMPESCARRDRSIQLLEKKHIYALSRLPLLGEEGGKSVRTLREVCGRAAALLVVSLYSECRLGEKISYEDAKAFVQPIIDKYSAEEFFSPREREYLNDPNSDEQEQIQYAWQYENLWVIEWALGLNDDLFWPNRICDVPGSVRIMQTYSSLDDLMAAAKLRDQKELLDQADLIYLLHWACVDARINGFPAPQDLEEGVVMERHRSLFWLAGCDGGCDWDAVDLST